MEKGTVAAIAAIGTHRELGYRDKLLWHIPDDLQRFKRLTFGHPVIMGRKTFDSIVGYLGKPFQGRTSVVVTRDPQYDASKYGEGVVVAHSLDEALGLARRQPGGEEVFIGGGAEIYRQALPRVDLLRLTIIDDTKLADAYFPEYEREFTEVAFEEAREWEGIKYRYVDLERG